MPPISPALILQIFQLVAAGLKVKESPAFADLREHIGDVVEQAVALREGLPTKADGTAFTDDEIAAIADRAEVGYVETLIREQGYV